MKKLLAILFFIWGFAVMAQTQQEIDNLVKVGLSQKSTSKYNANINRDSLVLCVYKAKTTAERVDLAYQITSFNGALSQQEALVYYNKLLAYSRKIDDKAYESVIMSEIAYYISINGNAAGSLALLQKALVLAKESGSNLALGIVYSNLGVSYPKNPEKRKQYFQLAQKYCLPSHNHYFVAANYGALYDIFIELNQKDSAQHYLYRGLKYSIDNHNDEMISTLILEYAKKSKNPVPILRKVLTMPIAKIQPLFRAQVLMELSVYYKSANQVDSTLYYAGLSKPFINQEPYFLQQIHTYGLYQIYKGINADSSNAYIEKNLAIKDSLYSNRNLDYAASMKFTEEQQARELALNYNNNLKLYALAGLIGVVLIILLLLWRNNRVQRKAFKALTHQKKVTDATLTELKQTQRQLIQSEKMASLGELTAGIAHEIQNPINFVNNFSDVSIELLQELKDEVIKGDFEEVNAIADDVIQNLEKIAHHGRRADNIVKGMLQHSRASSGQKEPTDINVLTDEYLRLAYHGLRAKDKSFNADLVTNFGEGLPNISIIPQDVGRVLLNLFTNAFYATQLKSKQWLVNGDQSQSTAGYKPVVEVITQVKGNLLEIIVKDNGTGIPDAIKDKILQPFFTTKPTGEGTGLGLSLSYDIIVKGHGGSIDIESVEGQGAVFKILLPINL